MGLREWILRPYLEKLKTLEGEVKALQEDNARVKNEILNIVKALDNKADKEDLNDVRLRLNSVLKALDNLMRQLDAVEIGLKGDKIVGDEEAQKELILRLISAGYNNPQGLKSMVPFGNKKLYKLLRELEAEGLIGKIKKGRKVYYITTAEAEEG